MEGGSLSPRNYWGESPALLQGTDRRPKGSRERENSGLGEGQAWLHGQTHGGKGPSRPCCPLRRPHPHPGQSDGPVALLLTLGCVLSGGDGGTSLWHCTSTCNPWAKGPDGFAN